MDTIRKVVLFVACAALAGCAINKETASFDPNMDLAGDSVFYVERFGPDKRGLEKIIADSLSTRGYIATYGEKGETPANATTVVTYVDKWQWDMTMYLIELTISFRDPQTGVAFATGNSYHTSLTRQSPENMVSEVLGNIFTADTNPEAIASK
jgi:hypothetical protein